jgi:hypothetical protein
MPDCTDLAGPMLDMVEDEDRLCDRGACSASGTQPPGAYPWLRPSVVQINPIEDVDADAERRRFQPDPSLVLRVFASGEN